jgi:hypothetical protein
MRNASSPVDLLMRRWRLELRRNSLYVFAAHRCYTEMERQSSKGVERERVAELIDNATATAAAWKCG